MFCMATTARVAGQFNNVHYTTVQAVSQLALNLPAKHRHSNWTPLAFTTQTTVRRTAEADMHTRQHIWAGNMC